MGPEFVTLLFLGGGACLFIIPVLNAWGIDWRNRRTLAILVLSILAVAAVVRVPSKPLATPPSGGVLQGEVR
jgi:hypothetical protein